MDREQSRNGSASARPETWPRGAPVAPPQRQRASIRKTALCTFQVHIGQSHVLTESAQDLSLTGVFVEMDSYGVLVGDPAEVLIGFADNDGRQCEHRITAEVVHVRPQGVALKFDQYGNRAYTDLVNLLYS
jgi:hypothetical protein